ncbi:hypothetical protein [Roseobacter sp. HKCCA0434]|uniref:hypothetical protein n=1 Tax=Roseobacter sp. HKCCA0434 TaxID=3079297 RepID=UPI002905CEE3|nr:hypothetical protein [Roseobacter sp. HKCCA0434]
MFRTTVTALALALAAPVSAETLMADRRLSTVLDDGTDVVLYGARGRGTVQYYYLPPEIGVSTAESGSPEFLFMKFASDDVSGLSGALLHFLVEWGLTPEQEEELATWVETEHGGELAGAATMHPVNADGPSFYIVSATLDDEATGGELVTSGQASLMPGGKAAAATRLNADGAQVLAATFEEDATIADVTAVMNMEYAVQVPGVDGTVTIDWSRIENERETIFAEYERTIAEDATTTRRCSFLWWGCDDERGDTYAYSYEEIHDQFSFLAESEYIDFDFVQGDIPEEVAGPIRDAFLQYFIASVTQASAPVPEARSGDDTDEEAPAVPDIRQGAGYTYDVTKTRNAIARGRQTLSLDMDLVVRYPWQLVGNMKDWYDVAVDDPFAVQEVLLADPFFQHRDIVFMLDGDIEDMFDQHVNAVTVEVRRVREGADFHDSILFNAATLAEGGNLGHVTYARGEDSGSDGYEYRTMWNFRGGAELVEPAAGWARGSWEGVTLSAPIESRRIEMEADLDEMDEVGITRVTAQVRHPVLGEEVERNIQMSVRGGEPLIEEEIFLDRDAGGYAYRLIFNHRRLGRLATEWSARSSDNYIWAAIPEELLPALEEDDADAPEVADAQAAVEEEDGDQLSRFNILATE